MKRGFLNSSKAKAQPLGPDLAATATGTALPKFPYGKQPKVDVPEGDSTPTQLDPRSPRMIYTTLPMGAPDTEPVSECFFFDGSKEVVLGLPGFPQPLVNPAQPAYRVAETPGKGLGLFSTRALKAGELILSERPLMVAPRGMLAPCPPSFTYEQYVQHSLNQLEKHLGVALKRMRPEDRKAYMALSNCHQEDGSGPILGILRTNALALQGLRPGVEDELRDYSAVFKDISRLNHSCSPNTAPLFHKSSFSYRLFAVRDIAAGEELTYQYVDVSSPKADRHAALKPYAFICTCPACTDPESDARRAALTKMGAPQVFAWLYNPPARDSWLLDECGRQLALIRREGLEHLPQHYEVLDAAMQGCIAMGDARGASEWAARLGGITWDADPADVSALLDPESPAYKAHPLWRKRADRKASRDPRQMMKELAALASKDGRAPPLGMVMGM